MAGTESQQTAGTSLVKVSQPTAGAPPPSSAASNIQENVDGVNAQIAALNDPYAWANIVKLNGEAAAIAGRQADIPKLEAAEQSTTQDAVTEGYSGVSFSPIETIPGEPDTQTTLSTAPTNSDSTGAAPAPVTASDLPKPACSTDAGKTAGTTIAQLSVSTTPTALYSSTGSASQSATFRSPQLASSADVALQVLTEGSRAESNLSKASARPKTRSSDVYA